MKSIIILILFAFQVLSQDIKNFPLWDSKWIIAKGMNERIYPSFSKSIPSHIVYVIFPSYLSCLNGNGKFVISWANLNHKEYTCTALMVDDIKSQFLSTAA
jgi:hypothetical protein